MDGTILIADDDRTIRTVLTQALSRAGCKVHATASLATLHRWVEEGRGDLVISDVMMPDGNGLDLLPRLKALRPDLPVFVISAQNTAQTAVGAETGRADDYLPKPFDLPDLLKRVARALGAKPESGHGDGHDQTGATQLPPQASHGLTGASQGMQDLFRLMAKLVNSPLPVLVTGESGTGKSLVARNLHELSDRRDLPLMQPTPEDMASAPRIRELLGRIGQGTLILDKLGDLDAAAQAHLRAAIDELPDPGPRIVSTSQVDLAQQVAQGRFREDLFYRLNGVTLLVPPLRERGADIETLAIEMLGVKGAQHRLSSDALAALRAYVWPGNLRQLRNVIQRLDMTAAGPEITAADVEAALATQPMAPQVDASENEQLAGSIARHLKRYFDLHGALLPPPGLYTRILHEMEVPLIEIALEATGGNQARCAELLGINRNTLRKKITDLDIEVTRRRKLM